MTLLDLAELPDAPVTRSRPRREKKSRTEMVIDYFEAHPGEWIDGLVFAEFAGAYAWRSRISDARKYGMNIENRQREGCDGSVKSEYRYVPEDRVLGSWSER